MEAKVFDLFGSLLSPKTENKVVLHVGDESAEMPDIFQGLIPPIGAEIDWEIHRECIQAEHRDALEFDAEGFLSETYKVTNVRLHSRIKPYGDHEEGKPVLMFDRNITICIDIVIVGESKPHHLELVK
jgi:hypothetical protein